VLEHLGASPAAQGLPRAGRVGEERNELRRVALRRVAEDVGDNVLGTRGQAIELRLEVPLGVRPEVVDAANVELGEDRGISRLEPAEVR
jgi:hypothetical protein